MDASTFALLIRRSAAMLAGVRTVGESGGWDDLYTVLDFVSDAFARTYPTQPCQAGCSHCCQEALFRVTALEAAALHRHLEAAWSAPEVAELFEQVERVWGPYRTQLDELSRYWSAHGLGASAAPLEGLPTRCALLDETGRCRAYEVRPVVCRSYGHFGVTVADKPTMLICQAEGPRFITALADGGTEAITIPPIEPFFASLAQLAPEGVMGPLPWWILGWRDAIRTAPGPRA